MEDTLLLLKNRLYEEACSCVIGKGSEVRTFVRQGVVDLFDLYGQEPAFLDGAFVADKVVGKAAAALILLGEVKAVYAGIISEPALDLFRNSGVAVEYGRKVPFIENLRKTGWCPLEAACYGINTLEEIYSAIQNLLAKTKQSV
jgi:iron complex outermembrane receptor protein/vitamin B12 transporter